MNLYKLINGELTVAPNNIYIDNKLHAPATISDLISEGYKELIHSEEPTNVKWFQNIKVEYIEESDKIVEVYSITIADNLKEKYYNILNIEADDRILNGFIFTDNNNIDHKVYLNIENQWNYSNEKAPCELKLNTYDWLQFNEQSELDRFKLEASNHIKLVLNETWDIKKNIKDKSNQEMYDYLLLL